MANGFRFAEGLKFFESRIVTAPEAAPGLKKIAADRLAWLNGQMNGKDYICGKRFTLADILLFGMVAFFSKVGQPLDPANANLTAWFERVKARPSANA
jgi:glutathione S-transferase